VERYSFSESGLPTGEYQRIKMVFKNTILRIAVYQPENRPYQEFGLARASDRAKRGGLPPKIILSDDSARFFICYGEPVRKRSWTGIRNAVDVALYNKEVSS
jgi:hypothetical protein